MAPVGGVGVGVGPHHQVGLAGGDFLVTPGTAVCLRGPGRCHAADDVLLTSPLFARLADVRHRTSRSGYGVGSTTVLAWHPTSLCIEGNLGVVAEALTGLATEATGRDQVLE